MKTPQLLDHRGVPIRRAELTQEVAGASTGGTRTPLTGTPADGLTPARLASILREAQEGDPLRYLELAEFMEERDLHYLGVLGTRRRSVTQIPITVKAASDKPEDVARAEMVERWLSRGELADELFDILDTIGKGYSFTEIMWDTSAGQWMPQRLEFRDPRWFRFDRRDLTTPELLTEGGQRVPLPPYKFISARIKAKSGIPFRAGIARAVAWAYLFKQFTQRDWQIFIQTYGHPVRVGKYQPGASEAEKRTLLRAVQNIAGDMAGIIPDSMMIDFITAQGSQSPDMYLSRVEYLDMQVSKAVLGQTATTDAVTGGLGSGKEHRQVQEDIERADAKALAAVLNRDLIQPWMRLEFGADLKDFPELVIERPQQEDLKALTDALGPMIDRGLQVDEDDIRAKFGLGKPKEGANLLRPAGKAADAVPGEAAPSPIKRISGDFKRGAGPAGMVAALQSSTAPAGAVSAPDPVVLLTDRLETEAAVEMGKLLDKIEAMIAAASSMDELRAMIASGFPDLSPDALADIIAKGMVAAWGGGMVAVAEESGE